MTTQHELLDAAIRKIGNRYLTTMLIAKRIRQLHHGAHPYVSSEEDESPFTIAVREIAAGLLTIDSNTTTDTPSVTTPALSDNGAPQDASLPDQKVQD